MATMSRTAEKEPTKTEQMLSRIEEFGTREFGQRIGAFLQKEFPSEEKRTEKMAKIADFLSEISESRAYDNVSGYVNAIILAGTKGSNAPQATKEDAVKALTDEKVLKLGSFVAGQLSPDAAYEYFRVMAETANDPAAFKNLTGLANNLDFVLLKAGKISNPGEAHKLFAAVANGEIFHEGKA